MRNGTLIFVLVIVSSLVQAGTYHWTNNSPAWVQYNAVWNNAGNWQEAVFPNSAVDRAEFVFVNDTGSLHLNLGEDITVGNISMVDNSNNSIFLEGSNTLTFDTGTNTAVWERRRNVSSGNALRMEVPCSLHLASNLEATWQVQRQIPVRGVISGPGRLTIRYRQQASDANTVEFGGSAPNTYAGGTVLNGDSGTAINETFKATKNGAFGSGDVRLNAYAVLNLTDQGGADDMISDTATLYLVSSGSAAARMKLDDGVNETVHELYINGEQQYSGTFGGSGSSAEIILDSYFSGNGILTVLSGGRGPGEIHNRPASEISTSGATLNGMLDATNSSPTRVFIYWGPTDGVTDPGQWEHDVDLGTRGPGSISTSVSGLAPLEIVYYRCCISNSLGVRWASPAETVKLHGPPEIQNEQPIIRRDYVMLRGTMIATNGFPTFARVYWGTNDAGTSAGGWQSLAELGPSANGILTTNITGLTEDQRYYFRFFATNAAGTAWAAGTDSFTAPGSLTFNDVTFFSISDSHYEATPEENTLKTAAVDRMNALPGIAFPAALGGGQVDVPRGVLALGDLINSGGNASLNTSQLTQWTNDFGVNGEKRVMFPVYEGFGNHDLSSSHLVQNAIKARTLERIGLKSVSSNGLHYSWDWDAVHFVQVNLFPGDVHQTPNYSAIHDPEYALDFLKKDLALNVGGSGRPVIIAQHYDPRDNWWTENQKSNFFNAITNYNVICIIHGHTGTGIYKWRGLDVVNDGNLAASIFVFHVTSNRLYVAQRKSDDTWGATLSKSIVIPGVPEPAGISISVVSIVLLSIRRFRKMKKPGGVFTKC